MARVTVEPLNVLDGAAWDFRDAAPRWRHPVFGNGRAHWDPFPAYPHDVATAEAAVAVVEAACPPLWDVRVFAADREDTGRTNGFSYLHTRDRYDPGTETWVREDPVGLVMLGGKRVPPHPAMTVYLVGHEYGHHVHWMVNQARGAQHATGQETSTAYLTVRGLGPEHDHHGDGGTWHDAVAEIMACDFRILVAGIEEAFWPHPGVPRPETVPGLTEWWAAALIDVEAARARPASVAS